MNSRANMHISMIVMFNTVNKSLKVHGKKTFVIRLKSFISMIIAFEISWPDVNVDGLIFTTGYLKKTANSPLISDHSNIINLSLSGDRTIQFLALSTDEYAQQQQFDRFHSDRILLHFRCRSELMRAIIVAEEHVAKSRRSPS